VLFLTNVIPEDKIAEIRSAADIVDVVSAAVLLKKSGKNYLGLCPFHSEKTPSFTVSPDKQIFHCFGCGEGGNIFSFVMKQEGITFPEAVRTLARRYNVSLPDRRMSPDQKRRIDERERLLAVNQKGMRYFRRALSDGVAGRIARQYLQKRKLTQATIDNFQIGYAPDGWDNVLNYLVRKRIPLDLIEKSGLIVPRKNRNGYYDRFRNRIVFPILDINNRVLGFGGRVMTDDLPKYLNSPETPVYNKSRSLYGLHLAKRHCRETGSVIVVEGYFDVIALHQHGVCNAVATLGTSLTSEHVRLLRGCIGENGKVLLVYDSDEAGIKAARRSIDVFDKEYVSAQILILDSGYDPDTYIFEYGAAEFKHAAAGAMDVIPFLLDTSIRRHGLSVEGKVKVVSELQDALTSLSDVVARSLYLKMMAEQLQIDETALLEKLRQTAAIPTTGGARRSIFDSHGDKDRISQIATTHVHARLEKQIIAMMLQVPEICPTITKLEALTCLESQQLSQIGQVILDCYSRSSARSNRNTARQGSEHEPQEWIADILGSLADEKDRQLVADMAIGDEAWNFDGCEKQVVHFVETTRKNRLQQDIDNRIKEAVHNQDEKLVDKLLIEKQSLAIKRERRKMALINRK
jgi:DNA primase